MTGVGRRVINRGRRARVERLESALRRLDDHDRAALRAAIEAFERAALEVMKPQLGRG